VIVFLSIVNPIVAGVNAVLDKHLLVDFYDLDALGRFPFFLSI